MKKAQVFISCGQGNPREKEFGHYLDKYFADNGFDTYFAEEIHSSKPLLLSIISALKESDYFVCFNPSRPYKSSKDKENIGSLFVQQEMSIAASLDLQEMIAFHEQNVDKTAGMIGSMHLNSIEVRNVKELKVILDKETKTWDRTSKNQLFLNFNNPHENIPIGNEGGTLSNWYHVTVLNGSSYKHAKNCMGYVDKIEDLTSKIEIPIKYKPELIWAGVGIHSITITKQKKRDLDALFTRLDSRKWSPQYLQTSTVPDYIYPILSDGKYRIIYSIVSDNFPDATLEVKVKLENNSLQIINQNQQ